MLTYKEEIKEHIECAIYEDDRIALRNLMSNNQHMIGSAIVENNMNMVNILISCGAPIGFMDFFFMRYLVNKFIFFIICGYK